MSKKESSCGYTELAIHIEKSVAAGMYRFGLCDAMQVYRIARSVKIFSKLKAIPLKNDLTGIGAGRILRKTIK